MLQMNKIKNKPILRYWENTRKMFYDIFDCSMHLFISCPLNQDFPKYFFFKDIYYLKLPVVQICLYSLEEYKDLSQVHLLYSLKAILNFMTVSLC